MTYPTADGKILYTSVILASVRLLRPDQYNIQSSIFMDLAMIILGYKRASTVIVLIANPKAVATASPICSDSGTCIRVAIEVSCPKSRERILWVAGSFMAL